PVEPSDRGVTSVRGGVPLEGFEPDFTGSGLPAITRETTGQTPRGTRGDPRRDLRRPGEKRAAPPGRLNWSLEAGRLSDQKWYRIRTKLLLPVGEKPQRVPLAPLNRPRPP